MVINLKQLYEIPGEKLELDAQVSPERLSEIHGYSFIGPVTLKGVFRNRAGIVTLEYTADVKISAECDRCLSSFERSYSFDFELVHIKVITVGNDVLVIVAVKGLYENVLEIEGITAFKAA